LPTFAARGDGRGGHLVGFADEVGDAFDVLAQVLASPSSLWLSRLPVGREPDTGLLTAPASRRGRSRPARPARRRMATSAAGGRYAIFRSVIMLMHSVEHSSKAVEPDPAVLEAEAVAAAGGHGSQDAIEVEAVEQPAQLAREQGRERRADEGFEARVVAQALAVGRVIGLRWASHPSARRGAGCSPRLPMG